MSERQQQRREDARREAQRDAAVLGHDEELFTAERVPVVEQPPVRAIIPGGEGQAPRTRDGEIPGQGPPDAA